ncbi:MAG: sodium:proton antiporter [Spirochaetaceae bacterium]
MSEYLIGLIFLVGLWGVLTKPNLIKKIVGLSIMNSAIVLFFVHHGARFGSTAPIREGAQTGAAAAAVMVDPLPQALMLTAIVVGICIIALGLALAVLLYRRFGTLDIRRIEAEAWSIRD